MLGVERAEVRYGSATALHDVSLTVPDGALVAVLGPSGSGKSTLLRAIAGLEPLASGRVTWDGRDLGHVAPHRRRFGLVFQDHALFPHRDVLGNVGFGLRMQRLARPEVEARARDALALVGLAGFDHRHVRQLSGGEQQRVALARALAPEPRLLLLDEPFASLDRSLREGLLVELRELFSRLGVTALTVTHDQEEAFALADHVVLLRDGVVEQAGSPEEVWRAPATEFAARFLGFTNVVDATVETPDGGAPVARGTWGPVPVPAGTPAGPLRLATRAGGLRLDPAGPVHGTVLSRTFRRDHFLLRVRTDGPGSAVLEVATDVTDPPPAGATVRLAVLPDTVVTLPAT